MRLLKRHLFPIGKFEHFIVWTLEDGLKCGDNGVIQVTLSSISLIFRCVPFELQSRKGYRMLQLIQEKAASRLIFMSLYNRFHILWFTD